VIVALDAPEALDARIEDVGGKAHGLAALFALGLPVPAGVVVPSTDAHVGEVDPKVIVGILGDGPFAVRSSAVAEDTQQRSAAGQYESVMGVTPRGLKEAVDRVIRSAGSERARAYSGAASPIAVVIQREIPAGRAGVAFSRDPVTGADEVVIECVFGHGEALVSGEALPDRYRVTSDGVVGAQLAVKSGPRRLLRTLRDDEALRIAALIQRAVDGFGRPVDIEFCLDRRALWLVQARSITTRAGAR
jgi:phosphoenolpyruvate synthase/pyruvate phosphate dikinase